MTTSERSPVGFLSAAEDQHLFDDDLAEVGFVLNASRMWAHQPALHDGLFDLLKRCTDVAELTDRQRGVLIAACAATLGDAYCSLAWGTRLAGETGAEVAGEVLRGDDTGLDPREQALAAWARQVVRDPNATTAEDVQALRNAGYDDGQVLALTTFVALRLAFSSVNDALAPSPDRKLYDGAPGPVRNAVTFGRPVGG